MTTTPTETLDEQRLSFRTSREQATHLERLARKHQRNISGEIRMALDVWIARCEKEEGQAA